MNFDPTPLRARVLIVDDSAFMREALTRMIASESGFEVAGTACDGPEALEKIPALDPDMVTLDLQLPGMHGLDVLRRIMLEFPRPVIVVSARPQEDLEAAASVLASGAFGYVSKQLSPGSLEVAHIREILIAKLRSAALHHGRSRLLCPSARATVVPGSPVRSNMPSGPSEIVAIGASTGGPGALEQILTRLPRLLAVPVLVVQHMPPGFAESFAERLNQLCALTVRIATHGEIIGPGMVYFAPSGRHMIVQRTSASAISINLASQRSNSLHVPSVDVMMKSVSRVFGERALGVILSGMGNDGAEGIRAIRLNGGMTIGQDEQTCVVYGMPRACAEGGWLTHILPVSEIPAAVLEATGYHRNPENDLLGARETTGPYGSLGIR